MPLPDRWLAYSAVGSIIEGTRLFACKVPLKECKLQNVQKREKFSTDNLVSMIKEKGHKLGLIIDLTNTFKYYDPGSIQKHSVEHMKIKTAGHEVPSNKVYSTFADTLQSFLEDESKNDQIVGVHCTHGVNRTGYLICRFMIERLNISPEEAITKFRAARGHPIERPNYLSDLRKRIPGQITPPSIQNEECTSRERPYNWRQNMKPAVHNSKYDDHSQLHNPSNGWTPALSNCIRPPSYRPVHRNDQAWHSYSNHHTYFQNGNSHPNYVPHQNYVPPQYYVPRPQQNQNWREHHQTGQPEHVWKMNGPPRYNRQPEYLRSRSKESVDPQNHPSERREAPRRPPRQQQRRGGGTPTSMYHENRQR